MNQIVVGVSGKTSGHPAIAWAAQYASDLNREILLLHVVDITWGVVPADFAEKALLSAEHQLRTEADRIRANYPGIRVHPRVVMGSPTQELLSGSSEASILVVGSHALERFGDYVFSTRAARLAAAAPCTVVIIPSGEVDVGAGVVVGADGSEASASAVEFAAAEADRFSEPLTAVYVWHAPDPWSDVPSVEWPAQPAEEDRLIVAESIAGLKERYPDLSVGTEIVTARPATGLYAASAGARMLVVGTHGRHGFAKFALGSVAQDMVLSMPCQVAVARPAR